MLIELIFIIINVLSSFALIADATGVTLGVSTLVGAVKFLLHSALLTVKTISRCLREEPLVGGSVLKAINLLLQAQLCLWLRVRGRPLQIGALQQWFIWLGKSSAAISFLHKLQKTPRSCSCSARRGGGGDKTPRHRSGPLLVRSNLTQHILALS